MKLYHPTTDNTQAIRAALRDAGCKARVRRFRMNVRVCIADVAERPLAAMALFNAGFERVFWNQEHEAFVHVVGH